MIKAVLTTLLMVCMEALAVPYSRVHFPDKLLAFAGHVRNMADSSLVLSLVNKHNGWVDCRVSSRLEGMAYMFVVDLAGKVWDRRSLSLTKGDSRFEVSTSAYDANQTYTIMVIHVESRSSVKTIFEK